MAVTIWSLRMTRGQGPETAYLSQHLGTRVQHTRYVDWLVSTNGYTMPWWLAYLLPSYSMRDYSAGRYFMVNCPMVGCPIGG